jgi:hypothetical protein
MVSVQYMKHSVDAVSLFRKALTLKKLTKRFSQLIFTKYGSMDTELFELQPILFLCFLLRFR